MTHEQIFGNPSLLEMRLITKIAKRAHSMALKADVVDDLLTWDMDITAAHAHCPLKLEELLVADDANFGHDVFGIRRHIDRETSELTGCFVPRYSAPEKVAA